MSATDHAGHASSAPGKDRFSLHPLVLPGSRQGWFTFLTTRCDDQLAKAQQLADKLSTEQVGQRGQAGEAGPAGTSSFGGSGPRGAVGLLRALGVWNEITLCLLNATAAAAVVSRCHTDADVRERARAAELVATAMGNRLRQDRRLYAVLSAADPGTLNAGSARTLRLTLRDFRRAGVELDEQRRRELQMLTERCTELCQQFERNVYDDDRTVHLRPDQMAGLPEDFVAAHPPGPDGLVELTATYPDLFPFLTFAHDREARRKLGTEFFAKAWPENDAVLAELLELRARRASLLGYDGWADYDAEVKMVGSAKAIAEFIDDLAGTVAPAVRAEISELEARLQRDHPGEELTQSDLWYYIDVLRRERFDVDESQIRRYLRLENVVTGMLAVNAELFGLEFRLVPDATTWHPDVTTYDVVRDRELIGRFHLDLHPRHGKFTEAQHLPLARGLAGVQLPQSVLLCNVPRDLLVLEDVVILFHEFGHLLNSILSGQHHWARDSGVATERDFVEAPAILLEDLPYNPAVLRSFAVDVDGNHIPAALREKIRASARVGRVFQVAEQIADSELSYRLHEERPDDLTAFTDAISTRHIPVRMLPGGHYYASFVHLGDERYSSGYYAYLWSRVIAEDFRSAFDPDNLYAPGPAHRFRDLVLAAGGSRDGHDLVADFLHRRLSTDAFHRWLSGP